MKSAVELAGYIDHTLLRADAVRSDIERLCAEAREHRFYAVCVNGCWVSTALHLLEETEVKVATVVGFPLGANSPDAKRYETEAAVDEGAQEIDMVLNVAWLKDGLHKLVLREMRDVVEAADDRPVKVILETCCLTRDQKIRACELAREAGARFVKTSTGFGAAGATLEDVALMREIVGSNMGVKASGGIRDVHQALAFINAGATRLGTSAGVGIVTGFAGMEGNY